MLVALLERVDVAVLRALVSVWPRFECQARLEVMSGFKSVLFLVLAPTVFFEFSSFLVGASIKIISKLLIDQESECHRFVSQRLSCKCERVNLLNVHTCNYTVKP